MAGVPLMAGVHSDYIKRTIGPLLTQCLREVTEVRPKDPIDFMARWLYNEANNEISYYRKVKDIAQCEKTRIELEAKDKERQVKIKKLKRTLNITQQESVVLEKEVEEALWRRRQIAEQRAAEDAARRNAQLRAVQREAARKNNFLQLQMLLSKVTSSRPASSSVPSKAPVDSKSVQSKRSTASLPTLTIPPSMSTWSSEKEQTAEWDEEESIQEEKEELEGGRSVMDEEKSIQEEEESERDEKDQFDEERRKSFEEAFFQLQATRQHMAVLKQKRDTETFQKLTDLTKAFQDGETVDLQEIKMLQNELKSTNEGISKLKKAYLAGLLKIEVTGKQNDAGSTSQEPDVNDKDSPLKLTHHKLKLKQYSSKNIEKETIQTERVQRKAKRGVKKDESKDNSTPITSKSKLPADETDALLKQSSSSGYQPKEEAISSSPPSNEAMRLFQGQHFSPDITSMSSDRFQQASTEVNSDAISTQLATYLHKRKKKGPNSPKPDQLQVERELREFLSRYQELTDIEKDEFRDGEKRIYNKSRKRYKEIVRKELSSRERARRAREESEQHFLWTPSSEESSVENEEEDSRKEGGVKHTSKKKRRKGSVKRVSFENVGQLPRILTFEEMRKMYQGVKKVGIEKLDQGYPSSKRTTDKDEPRFGDENSTETTLESESSPSDSLSSESSSSESSTSFDSERFVSRLSRRVMRAQLKAFKNWKQDRKFKGARGGRREPMRESKDLEDFSSEVSDDVHKYRQGEELYKEGEPKSFKSQPVKWRCGARQQLICQHPDLGDMTSAPPQISEENIQWWESQNLIPEVLIDNELYTRENDDFVELYNPSSPVLTLRYFADPGIEDDINSDSPYRIRKPYNVKGAKPNPLLKFSKIELLKSKNIGQAKSSPLLKSTNTKSLGSKNTSQTKSNLQFKSTKTEALESKNIHQVKSQKQLKTTVPVNMQDRGGMADSKEKNNKQQPAALVKQGSSSDSKNKNNNTVISASCTSNNNSSIITSNSAPFRTYSSEATPNTRCDPETEDKNAPTKQLHQKTSSLRLSVPSRTIATNARDVPETRRDSRNVSREPCMTSCKKMHKRESTRADYQYTNPLDADKNEKICLKVESCTAPVVAVTSNTTVPCRRGEQATRTEQETEISIDSRLNRKTATDLTRKPRDTKQCIHAKKHVAEERNQPNKQGYDETKLLVSPITNVNPNSKELTLVHDHINENREDINKGTETSGGKGEEVDLISSGSRKTKVVKNLHRNHPEPWWEKNRSDLVCKPNLTQTYQGSRLNNRRLQTENESGSCQKTGSANPTVRYKCCREVKEKKRQTCPEQVDSSIESGATPLDGKVQLDVTCCAIKPMAQRPTGLSHRSLKVSPCTQIKCPDGQTSKRTQVHHASREQSKIQHGSRQTAQSQETSTSTKSQNADVQGTSSRSGLASTQPPTDVRSVVKQQMSSADQSDVSCASLLEVIGTLQLKSEDEHTQEMGES